MLKESKIHNSKFPVQYSEFWLLTPGSLFMSFVFKIPVHAPRDVTLEVNGYVCEAYPFKPLHYLFSQNFLCHPPYLSTAHLYPGYSPVMSYPEQFESVLSKYLLSLLYHPQFLCRNGAPVGNPGRQTCHSRLIPCLKTQFP